MDKQTATQLIGNTFNFPFDEGRFRNFAINLLNNVDEAKRFDYISGTYIRHSFKNHITKYKRLGTYTDPNGDKIDVLVVQLKNEWALERSRTMLRNFTSDYLKNRDEKDAALVAYYTTNPDDWRFSYIRMEYKRVQTDSGKFKIKEDITPAKRYSFLVGKNEPNHTAQAQLVGILSDDRKNPTLSELENAFSVDAVTKQFYKDYRAQFEKLWNELNDIVEKDPKIAEEFETKTIDTANFAKKLMGQIVFLYFLQKKGWLGVGKDESGNFKEWGKGPKNFLRRLFDKEFINYGNFFNDVLEPLFYEALATERTNDVFTRFNCKIPFLNGGLFEPINDYNWEETDIRIDNDLIGEVFKTFDQYNFTVREDEPLEKEVAVDPEMLGKVFENLLPENLRKGKGAYYTPRTIVHYMCQESLINYLDTECEPAPKEDIETLIREGDIILELETAIVEEGKKYKSVLMDSIKDNAQSLDDALANIKVCDPAIGSGAFPVGMLTEIVKARNVLSLYLESIDYVDGALTQSMHSKERTTYNLKRHCIQNSLYGVDIDPGAIEIAKLRLWLSLVVDEDDYTTIQPLPNLDYKIMQGNSLIEEFHGISLDIEKKNEQQGLFSGGSDLDTLIDDLHQKQDDFFNAEHPREKKQKREAVETAIYNIFHNELEKKKNIAPQEAKEIETDLKEMTHGHRPRTFFPWHLYFADIFREKGGFDVMIGNPPWEKFKPLDPEFFERYFKEYRVLSKSAQKLKREELLENSKINTEYDKYLKSFKVGSKYFKEKYDLQGSGDLNLYKLFLELVYNLSGGTVSFLIPGQITVDKGCMDFRREFLSNKSLWKVIGLNNRKGLFLNIDNNQKFVMLFLDKNRQIETVDILGWLDRFMNYGDIVTIKIKGDLIQKLDEYQTIYLDTNNFNYDFLKKLNESDKFKSLTEIEYHYWREYDVTMDSHYFDDVSGRFPLSSGKAIDQYDCKAKSWLEKHGRSSKWRRETYPKSEDYRTEYYVSVIPDRITQHHLKDDSQFRIVIQTVTGAVNNVRTLYASCLPKTNLTNNSLGNLFIGESDEELFFYLAILNSFVVDWQARMKVATNLNKFILDTLFIPVYYKTNKIIRNEITELSIKLSCVSSTFDELTLECFGEKSDDVLIKNLFDRQNTKNKLDSMVAKLFELSANELENVLSTFPLVKREIKNDVLRMFIQGSNG